jgi:6-pyruvoyltetrahydropterin/6-carboxytetrahydropterin synthase
LVDYQPTSENMVIDFAQRIIARLPADIKLCFKVARNRVVFAEWYASDNL